MQTVQRSLLAGGVCVGGARDGTGVAKMGAMDLPQRLQVGLVISSKEAS